MRGRTPGCRGWDRGKRVEAANEPDPSDDFRPNRFPVEQAEYRFDGARLVNGSCGDDTYCQSLRYAAPGSYQVEVCANRAGPTTVNPENECELEGEVCKTAQFEFPSSEPVLITFAADE